MRAQRSKAPRSLTDPLINPQLGCSSKPTQLGLSREAEAGGRQTGQQFVLLLVKEKRKTSCEKSPPPNSKNRRWKLDAWENNSGEKIGD